MNSFSIIIILLVIIICPIKSYIFSIIIAVYNAGRYLDDSIGSLLNQTIDFEKIQIILVNDGSTDDSEKICLNYHKEYKKNIIYTKIEHGGVSRARNAGLKFAKGEFINFLDADDKWDSQALRYISIFFKTYKNVDLVAGRLLFFEVINTFHPLDYKFYKTRVVNLTKEYNCIHLSGASTFFRNSLIKGRKFMENIFTGEDTIFINNILLLKPIIGYVREAIYYYRRRSDYSSAVQTQVQKVEFYFSQMKYVGQYLLDKSKELYNKVIPFIQFYIGYNVLFRILSPAFKFLNSRDFHDYCKIIEGQLDQIEDKYILEQKFTSYKNKLFTLSKKHNRDLRHKIVIKNKFLFYSGYIIMDLNYNNNIIIWRFLDIKDNILHLEGKDNFWLIKENYYYFCKNGNKIIFPTYKDYSGYDYYTMYGLVEKGRIVIFDVPIINENEQIIKFFLSYNDYNYEIFPSFGTFTHIPEKKDGYYSNGKYIIKKKEKRLALYKYDENLEKSFEEQYCSYLKNISKENIIELRNENKKYHYSIKKKKIWIINDKQYQARDNGEYFFRYLIHKNVKDIDIFFVIKKESNDYERLKQIGNILDIDSKKYLDLFLKADKLISSVSDYWVTNPFGNEQIYLRDILHFDFIFIQDGIIKDDLSSNLNRFNKNFSLLITSSKKEYKSIVSSKYGYNKNNVILTGLPRYDYLMEYMNLIKKEKLIIVFPTWRTYIKGTRDLVSHKSIHSDYFRNTSFYSFYNEFINDKKLINNMKKFNYTGILCLHPYFSEQSEDFKTNKYFLVKGDCNYQELLTKASLFITDYSNVFFDFAYLKKPIVYAQFDIEDYRKYHYPKGYYDYIKDGFGPVCNDIECTIKEVTYEIINNCKIKKIYLRRIQKFFAFFDKKNSERIYNMIMKNTKENTRNTKERNIFYFLPFFVNVFFLFIKIKTII